MKKKAWKWILIFFAGMLAFTIISRAADSVTIPRVKTQMPGKGSLSFSAEGEGTIAAENEQIIFFPAGGKPSEIISAGAEVKRGDTLLRFDMDALKEKAEAENAELKKLELAKKQEALGAGADAQIKEQDAAGRTVSRINEQLDKARGELAKNKGRTFRRGASGAGRGYPCMSGKNRNAFGVASGSKECVGGCEGE